MASLLSQIEQITLIMDIASISVYVGDVLDHCWTPCICKMGKIANFLKEACPSTLVSSYTEHHHNPQLVNARSCSDGVIPSDTNPNVTLSGSYVQIESLPIELQKYSSVTNDDKDSHSATDKSKLMSRSLSVDESESCHYSYDTKNIHDASSVSDGQLTESFCNLDAPLYSVKSNSSGSGSSSYFKTAQKLLSYNPFKSSSKSSSNNWQNIFTATTNGVPIKRNETQSHRNGAYSPKHVNTLTEPYSLLYEQSLLTTDSSSSTYSNYSRESSTFQRENSLDPDTLEMLSSVIELERLCSDCHSWKPVVIVLAVRMGGDTFNPLYERVIKNLLSYRLCIGMVGGKARKAFYFVGYQGEIRIQRYYGEYS